MSPRELGILQSASTLLAAILTTRDLSASNVVKARWAAIETARKMADEIESLEAPDMKLAPEEIDIDEAVGKLIMHFSSRAEPVEHAINKRLATCAMAIGGNAKDAAKLLGVGRTTVTMRLLKQKRTK